MVRVRSEVRRRCAMMKKVRARLAVVQELLEAERDFWPVTVRRVFYAYIGKFALPSEPAIYSEIQDVLLRGRLTGEIPWEAIEDRTRGMIGSDGWPDAETFVDAHRRDVLTNYQRDLQEGQGQRLEVWVEKDALAHIAERAAGPYTVRVGVARGFSSLTFKHEAAERIRETAATGQRIDILYFGDLDPSGAYMPQDIIDTFDNDFGLQELVAVWHCGLLPEQVAEHGLPSSPDAIKEKDTRTAWFRRTYPGQNAVELDALPPVEFFGLVQESIEWWIDRDVFDAQQAIEADEAGEIEDVRAAVVAAFPSEN